MQVIQKQLHLVSIPINVFLNNYRYKISTLSLAHLDSVLLILIAVLHETCNFVEWCEKIHNTLKVQGVKICRFFR